MLDRHGADAFRWYLLHRPEPVGLATASASRRSTRPCASSCSRSGTRTRSSSPTPRCPTAGPRGARRADAGAPRPLDRWVARRASTARRSGGHRRASRPTTPPAPAGRSQPFVDELVQLVRAPARRRFWRVGTTVGRPAHAAFATLHECLVTVAPSCSRRSARSSPTRSTRNLVAAHDPAAPERAPGRLAASRAAAATARSRSAMAAVARGRRRSGRAARAEARRSRCASRSPRPSSRAPPDRRGRGDRDASLDRADELNVEGRALRQRAGRAGAVEVKPNYRTLGPRFGKAMPRGGRGGRRARRRGGRARARRRGAGRRSRSTDRRDGARSRRPAARGAAHASGTPSLRTGRSRSASRPTSPPSCAARAWLARSSTPSRTRGKAAGLRVEERIRLHLDGSGAAARGDRRATAAQIAAETLAVELTVGHGAPFGGIHHEEHVLDGEPLAVRLGRA